MGVGDDDGVSAGGVEGGGRGTEGGGIDGATSREVVVQRAGNLGSLTAQTKISL
jgi:hypothetical protein